MLAPMQGLSNRGMRRTMGEWVHPDVLFTEFLRIRQGAKRLISESDRLEALATVDDIPLVVQLIGTASSGVVEAAQILQSLGVKHINLNMGCPFGRMAAHLSGGGMFKDPTSVPPFLRELRQVVRGSLSVKTRSGFDNPRQIFELLPAFERSEIDFLILHPRTVQQKYEGRADHRVTADLVQATSLPVVANGDITNAEIARKVLTQTQAHGLMLGRGALADPLLFERIRGRARETPKAEERILEMKHFLTQLATRYQAMFCGDMQVLAKLKGSIAYIDHPVMERWVKSLRRSKGLESFMTLVQQGPT